MSAATLSFSHFQRLRLFLLAHSLLSLPCLSMCMCLPVYVLCTCRLVTANAASFGGRYGAVDAVQHIASISNSSSSSSIADQPTGRTQQTALVISR